MYKKPYTCARFPYVCMNLLKDCMQRVVFMQIIQTFNYTYMKHLLAYFLLVLMGTRVSNVLPTMFGEIEWGYPVQGLMIGLIIFLSTHYRLMRNEKLLSEEKLGLFLKIIHKTHTPLTLIQNLIGEIAACELPETASGNIKYVATNINYVIDRYRNVMLFDKMDEKMQSGSPTVEFELFAYITSIINQCRTYARTNQVQLKVSKSPGYVSCRINEITMTAALQYLVEQIIDITPKEGCVNIEVSYMPDSWSLKISNCPDNEVDSYRMFWQLYALMSVHCCGSLRLVKKIIRLHGGKMIRTGRKHAATFQVTIPLNCPSGAEYCMKGVECSDKREGIVKKYSSLESGRIPHILLIMADKELSNYLERSLSDMFRVSILEDAENISCAFCNKCPDAIIIDETVNGILGDELCSGIKSDAHTCDIPVILLTYSDDNESYLNHLRCGADKLEQRMVNICKLKADIQLLIDNHIAQREHLRKFMTDSCLGNLPEITSKSEEDAQFMEKVNQLLEENLSESVYLVKKLGSEMGMCRTKFYNKIMDITGRSPQEYIFSFKMEKAKQLLLAQQYKMEDIATFLGYCDGRYFGKRFKEFYHVSPTQFVKNATGSIQELSVRS